MTILPYWHNAKDCSHSPQARPLGATHQFLHPAMKILSHTLRVLGAYIAEESKRWARFLEQHPEISVE